MSLVALLCIFSSISSFPNCHYFVERAACNNYWSYQNWGTHLQKWWKLATIKQHLLIRFRAGGGRGREGEGGTEGGQWDERREGSSIRHTVCMHAYYFNNETDARDFTERFKYERELNLYPPPPPTPPEGEGWSFRGGNQKSGKCHELSTNQ